MFNTQRSEEDFTDVQKLLAMKRLDVPPQRYFDEVLHEFHERQRAVLLEPRYGFISRVFAYWEATREALLPRPALRYAYMGAAMAVLIGFGLNQSWHAGNQSPSLALQNNSPVMEGNGFAFSQALEPQQVSSVDQQIDAASIEPVRLDNKHVMPHYVMAQAPTSYDTTMAF